MGSLNRERIFSPQNPTCTVVAVGLASSEILAAPATGFTRRLLIMQNTSPDTTRNIACNFGASAVLASAILMFPQNAGLVLEGDSVPQNGLNAIADGTDANIGLTYIDEVTK